MKKGKTKEELVEYLKIYLPFLLNDNKALSEVDTHLESVHGISKGAFMRLVSNERILADQDIAFLAMLTEQVSKKVPSVGNDLNLNEWFTDHEIKSYRNFIYVDDDLNDEISLPLTFENVDYLGNGYYAAIVENDIIARLRKYHIIEYDFESQREPRYLKIRGEYLPTVKLNYRNIKEMKELILEGQLISTSLAYNCTFGSTTDESGVEMIYNKKERTLHITEGTQITFSDGTHRTTAIYEVYKETGHVEGKTVVYFSNFTPAEARRYQVQISKQSPVDSDRITIMEDKSLSIELTNKLNASGILKNKIDTSLDSTLRDECIIRQIDLARGFDELWKPKDNKEVVQIINIFNDYLTHYYDFIYLQDNKYFENKMIYDDKLYIINIALAKLMHEQNIPFENIGNILDKYDIENNEQLRIIKNKIAKTNKTKKPYRELTEFAQLLLDK